MSQSKLQRRTRPTRGGRALPLHKSNGPLQQLWPFLEARPPGSTAPGPARLLPKPQLGTLLRSAVALGRSKILNWSGRRYLEPSKVPAKTRPTGKRRERPRNRPVCLYVCGRIRRPPQAYCGCPGGHVRVWQLVGTRAASLNVRNSFSFVVGEMAAFTACAAWRRQLAGAPQLLSHAFVSFQRDAGTGTRSNGCRNLPRSHLAINERSRPSIAWKLRVSAAGGCQGRAEGPPPPAVSILDITPAAEKSSSMRSTDRPRRKAHHPALPSSASGRPRGRGRGGGKSGANAWRRAPPGCGGRAASSAIDCPLMMRDLRDGDDVAGRLDPPRLSPASPSPARAFSASRPPRQGGRRVCRLSRMMRAPRSRPGG